MRLEIDGVWHRRTTYVELTFRGVIGDRVVLTPFDDDEYSVDIFDWCTEAGIQVNETTGCSFVVNSEDASLLMLKYPLTTCD